MRQDEMLKCLRIAAGHSRPARGDREGPQRPSGLIDQLRRTGIFGLGVPRVIGGAETSPVDILRAIETVATAMDRRVCAMIGTANNVSAGYMNEFGAKEIFADPTAPTAGIASPAGMAVRVGRRDARTRPLELCQWHCHCDWLWPDVLSWTTASADDAQGPRDRACVHAGARRRDPRHLVRERIVWDREQRFQCQRCLRSEHRTFSLFDPSGHRQEPLYRMPILGLFVSQVSP